tara:strand:- start:163 stop:1158 length:996 start_codon:yes stop_codon:yes gene_type:complete
MKIQLSFCIPTYNRVGKLENAVKSIINSIEKSQKNLFVNFEIVISDNCSTDNTEEVVSKMIKTFGSENIIIKYFRNEINVGASKNFINLPKLASGEYIWFFSDDDYMLETAVDSFLNIYTKKYSFIFSARLLADKDLNIKNIKSQPQLGKLNSEFKTGYEMVNKLGVDIMGVLGFYSSIIIKRELWINDKRIFSDASEFEYLKILLDVIKLNSCFIIEKPGVLCRVEYRGFNGNDSYVWLDNYIDAFHFANEIGYVELRCKEMVKSILRNFSLNFVISKALGKRKGNLFQFKKSKLWYDEKYFNYLFLISLLPSFALNFLYRIRVFLKTSF